MNEDKYHHTLFRSATCSVVILFQCFSSFAQVTDENVSLKNITPQEVIEGDDGDRVIEILPQLQKSLPFPVVVGITTRPQTATSIEDYTPISKTATFPAGRIHTGLPRPESSGDALARLINIQLGFGMEMLADITRPTSLAISRNQPDFEEGIYVAQTMHNNDTKPDQIFHVSFDGTSVKTFVSLLPEADPTGLDFAPLDGPFKPGLYVSSNNRDGGRPGDWGGTIQWIDSEQNIVDFTGIGTPNGPGEPGELAFGTHGWMRDLLLVVNSVGSPADILNISFDGELEPLFSDGLFDQSNAGNAFRSLAIPPEDSPFGDWVYMGEFGRDCVCIQRWHPERGLKPFVSNLEGSPHGMAFTSGSLFGNNLYVAIDLGNEGKVLRIDSNGTISEFISGLQGFLYGNGKDVLQFDEEHELLYVSDYYGHRIYRIGEEEGPLEVTIHGDTTPEPDETLLVEMNTSNNDVLLQIPVTILNDDGAIPELGPEPEPEPEPVHEPELPPVIIPTLHIAFETPLNRQSFEMDFTQSPAFARIPISLNVEGTAREPTVTVFVNEQRIQTFTSPPYTTQWETEQIGEYLLTAIAEDGNGHQVTATPIRIQVVQSSGNIFIIEEARDLQSERMQAALFEMGLTGWSVHPSSISAEWLSKADLVIWKQSLRDSADHPELATTLLHAQAAGMPLYVLTDAPALNTPTPLFPLPAWTELTGIPQLDMYPAQKQTLLPALDLAHAFLLGQYGTVKDIQPQTPIYHTSVHPQFDTRILNTDADHFAMAASDPFSTSTPHQDRMVVQLFPVFPDVPSGDRSGQTSLFQNTVCWLLHCTPCENMDLALSSRHQEPDISQGNSWETEFTLQHVGECVASGVYVDFAWSDHLTATELVSETGWQEHLPHTIRLHLGTVASASRHAFVLKMKGQANQTGFVTATVHASNGEAIRENNLTWSGIAIEEPEPWLRAIMLPGDIPALILPSNLDLSKPINLQWSMDLQNWTTWESYTRENVTLIPETFRDKEASFYRVGP